MCISDCGHIQLPGCHCFSCECIVSPLLYLFCKPQGEKFESRRALVVQDQDNFQVSSDSGEDDDENLGGAPVGSSSMNDTLPCPFIFPHDGTRPSGKMLRQGTSKPRLSELRFC
jgi:hypothetical protein